MKRLLLSLMAVTLLSTQSFADFNGNVCNGGSISVKQIVSTTPTLLSESSNSVKVVRVEISSGGLATDKLSLFVGSITANAVAQGNTLANLMAPVFIATATQSTVFDNPYGWEPTDGGHAALGNAATTAWVTFCVGAR